MDIIISNSCFYRAAFKLIEDKAELPQYLSVYFTQDKVKKNETKPLVIEDKETINNTDEVNSRLVFSI